MMASVSVSKSVCLLLGFFCLGLALVLCGANNDPYRPSRNCGKFFECAPYTVLGTYSGFEMRVFDPALWVSSPNLTAQSLNQGARVGLRMVGNYLEGFNQQRKEIMSTGPVLVDVENSTYTVHCYLPKADQSSPPTPLASDKIKVEQFPMYKYAAVRRVYYDQDFTQGMIPRELDLLKAALDSTQYKRAAALDRYTIASYNRPAQGGFYFFEIILWFD